VSQERTRRVLVEFCGLPGVGKTTLAAHAARELAARGLPVSVISDPCEALDCPPITRTRKVGHSLRTVLLHPGAALGWLGVVLRSRQRTTLDLARVLHRWLFLTDLAARRWSGIRVHDQGVLQALWSMLYRSGVGDGPDPAVCERLSRLVPECVVVARVHTDATAWRERLAGRAPHSRLERTRSEGDGEAELAHVEECMDRAVACIRVLAAEHGRAIELVEVDNSDPDGWRACVGPIVEAAARAYGQPADSGRG
jgi:hypothetical protein